MSDMKRGGESHSKGRLTKMQRPQAASRVALADIVDEYVRLLRSGRAPSAGRFLRKYPGRSMMLRDAIEGAELLHHALMDFRQEHPAADPAEFFSLRSR